MTGRFFLRFRQITFGNLAPVIFLVGLHLSTAVFYKEVVGIDIAANPRFRPWDWWWQTIPIDLLANRLWESLWYLHAQPPLYNLYGAFFLSISPDRMLPLMQYGNILLGSLIPGMYFVVLKQMTGRYNLSLIIGITFALDPSLFLFEAYILYDLLTIFLIVSSVFLLVLYIKTNTLGVAVLFILALNLLVLTRSAYHFLIIPIALLLICVAASDKWKKILITGGIICLFSFGWYAKNYILYGFFGASSWLGFSLWEVTSIEYSSDALNTLSEQGIIEPMVAHLEVFNPPSTYGSYGYIKESEIPLLNGEDFHNINIIDIAAVYRDNALALILNYPKSYLRSVWRAYQIFNFPTCQFKHHILNIEKIQPHVDFYAQIIEGGILDNYLPIKMGTIFFVMIPASILGYIGFFLFSVIKTPKRWIGLIRQEIILLWMLLLITYTTFIGTFLEIGENNRERFYIEQLVVAFVIILILKGVMLVRERHTARV
jgi:hypothetical protein